MLIYLHLPSEEELLSSVFSRSTDVLHGIDSDPEHKCHKYSEQKPRDDNRADKDGFSGGSMNALGGFSVFRENSSSFFDWENSVKNNSVCISKLSSQLIESLLDIVLVVYFDLFGYYFGSGIGIGAGHNLLEISLGGLLGFLGDEIVSLGSLSNKYIFFTSVICWSSALNSGVKIVLKCVGSATRSSILKILYLVRV